MPKKNKTGKQTIKEILESANSAQYCMNCQYSYINEDNGNGYCKFTREDERRFYPKNIKEYDTCDHWKKK